eukprot:10736407-Alexandrium_andersonii.AAC.1
MQEAPRLRGGRMMTALIRRRRVRRPLRRGNNANTITGNPSNDADAGVSHGNNFVITGSSA